MMTGARLSEMVAAQKVAASDVPREDSKTGGIKRLIRPVMGLREGESGGGRAKGRICPLAEFILAYPLTE
jgi:hypothetical protein